MIRFNKSDLHNLNISQERFLEIIKDFGFKIDERKFNVKQLYDLTMQAITQSVEKSPIYKPKILETKEDAKEFSEKQREENNQAFFTKVAIICFEIIKHEVMEKYIKAEELKKQIIEYDSYMRSKANESDIIDKNIQIIHNEQILAQEHQEALDNYKVDLENKINLWKSELNALRKRKKQLQFEEQKILENFGKDIVKDLRLIKDPSGKSIFENYTDKQIEDFSKDYLSKSNQIERDTQNKIVPIEERQDQIKIRKQQIAKEKYQQKSKTAFEKNKNQQTVTLAFSGEQKIRKLTQEEKELDEEFHRLEREKANLKVDEKRLKAEALREALIINGIDPSSITQHHTTEELTEMFEHMEKFKQANEELHEVREEREVCNKLESELCQKIKDEIEDIKEFRNDSTNSNLDFEELDLLEDNLDDLIHDMEMDVVILPRKNGHNTKRLVCPQIPLGLNSQVLNEDVDDCNTHRCNQKYVVLHRHVF